MKLYTEISDCGKGDVMVVYNGDCGLSPDEQAERDLLAAHALLQAIREFVDPVPIEKRAAEILAGWMGEDRG